MDQSGKYLLARLLNSSAIMMEKCDEVHSILSEIAVVDKDHPAAANSVWDRWYEASDRVELLNISVRKYAEGRLEREAK